MRVAMRDQNPLPDPNRTPPRDGDARAQLALRALVAALARQAAREAWAPATSASAAGEQRPRRASGG